MMEAEDPPPPIATAERNNNCQNSFKKAPEKSQSFLIGFLLQVIIQFYALVAMLV
jgi:hypothetical protein